MKNQIAEEIRNVKKHERMAKVGLGGMALLGITAMALGPVSLPVALVMNAGFFSSTGLAFYHSHKMDRSSINVRNFQQVAAQDGNLKSDLAVDVAAPKKPKLS